MKQPNHIVIVTFAQYTVRAKLIPDFLAKHYNSASKRRPVTLQAGEMTVLFDKTVREHAYLVRENHCPVTRSAWGNLPTSAYFLPPAVWRPLQGPLLLNEAREIGVNQGFVYSPLSPLRVVAKVSTIVKCVAMALRYYRPYVSRGLL